MKKLSIMDQVINYHDEYGEGLRFISGKWFGKDNREIRDPKKYILSFMQTLRKTRDHWKYVDISDARQLDLWLDTYISLYGERGEWPEPTIIKEAREGEAILPLAFPLDGKQLKIIHLICFRSKEQPFIFIVTGVGGSGKSTFLNIIEQIFEGDAGHASLDDLDNPFQVEEAVKHRVILSSELRGKELDNRVIKQISDRETIQVNPKGRQPYEVDTQSAMIFATNMNPRIDVQDTGILRRIVFYCRNDRIPNPDTRLKRKRYTHDELVNIVRAARCVDMSDCPVGEYPAAFEKETHEIIERQNSVYIYRDAKTYSEYRKMCQLGGMSPYSEIKWVDIKDTFRSWGVRFPEGLGSGNDIREKVLGREYVEPYDLDDDELPF